MEWTLEQGRLWVNAGEYTLAILPNRPFAELRSPAGAPMAELFIFSAANTLTGRDDSTGSGAWKVAEETGGGLHLSLEVQSSIWDKKIIHFHCLPGRLVHEIELFGQGRVAELTYFGGHFSGIVRWGSGFFWSGQQFLQGFSPEPNAAEKLYFAPASGASIDLMGVPLPGRADWFFTPAPFCFALQTQVGWIGAGILAAQGQNQYTTLRYHGRDGAFYLSLDCEGSFSVDGHAILPAVGLEFAGDEYTALARHTAALRSAGWAAAVQPTTRPAWWQGPIFCGWGAQCHLAALQKGRAPAFARQEHYQTFLQNLSEHGLSPGIVVIDDKWQRCYGTNEVDDEKWPDLPGFIAARHAAGQKVLLWLKAWDPEGLPADECVTNAAGLPVAFDPTRPEFCERMANSVRRMLSETQGYGADGFKIDFSARIPSGPGMRWHGPAWGLELMRAYLELLYRTAKSVKPDALVIAHTPHPYLADVVDMIRLNDVNTGSDVVAQMRHRARVARLACPQALIDTDNWPMVDKAAWRAYLPVQAELGVPALYFDTAVDSTGEALDEEDYRLVREIWAQRAWIKE